MMQNKKNSPSQEGSMQSKSHKNIKDLSLKHKIIYAGGILLGVFAVLIFLAVLSSVARRSDMGMSAVPSVSKMGYVNSIVPEEMPMMEMDEDSFGSGQSLRMVAEPMAVDEELSVDKKIIKNGNLNLKVDNIDWAADKITDIVSGFDGDVVRSNFYESASGVKSGSITVKVPVTHFDNAFDELKKVATLVTREDTNSSDVTEQYTDLQAQLKNKQREEEAFAEILKRSGDIEDVLKVTKELSRVRGEIERLQGRIKYLESQTDMSTITIQLSEDVEVAVSRSWRPWEVIKESAQGLLRDSQNMIDFLISFIIRGLPRLAVYVLILWIVYKIVRKVFDKLMGK